MSKITRYICPCCGGRVNRTSLTCEYCGTEFKEENHTLIKVETFQNPVVTLAAGMRISHHDLYRSPKELSEYAIKRLANQFAECIAPYMDVEYRFDPWDASYVLEAKIKIVNPIHKPSEAILELDREIIRRSNK